MFGSGSWIWDEKMVGSRSADKTYRIRNTGPHRLVLPNIRETPYLMQKLLPREFSGARAAKMQVADRVSILATSHHRSDLNK
jgi:hypothetical protein